MKAVYRKNLGKSYMCIEEEGSLIEPYEVQMLEQHNIPYLLQMQTVISEGKRRYLYDISGKQQITDYFSGRKMGYDMLRMFLFSIYEVCGNLSEYLLREEGLCLEMEYIYVNLEDCRLQFTYVPFYEKNLPEAFQAFMEQILRKIDHQDETAVELGYQAYQFCAGENTNIGKLLETVLGKRMICEEMTVPQETTACVREDEKEGEGEPMQEYPQKDKGRQRVAEFFRKHLPWIYEIIVSVGEKTIWTGGKMPSTFEDAAVQVEETVQEEEDVPIYPTEIIGVRKKEPIGKLVYHGAQSCEDIMIDGDSFLLGKNREQVNGMIPAEGVSRLHARITRQGEEYYIEDLNSTNGTYLNDVMLEYHQPMPLKPKDKVRFGVEEYVFL